MFASVTATGVVAAATSWASNLVPVVLVVIGFGVALLLANWVVAKFRSSRAGGRKRRK
jgi:hypothetical protein